MKDISVMEFFKGTEKSWNDGVVESIGTLKILLNANYYNRPGVIDRLIENIERNCNCKVTIIDNIDRTFSINTKNNIEPLIEKSLIELFTSDKEIIAQVIHKYKSMISNLNQADMLMCFDLLIRYISMAYLYTEFDGSVIIHI